MSCISMRRVHTVAINELSRYHNLLKQFAPRSYPRTSRLMLMSSCQKKFNIFLHDSQLLQEGSMITAIDSVTNEHLDNVAKIMFPRWQDTKHYSYDLYYVLNNADKMPLLRLDLDKYFIKELTVDHVQHVANYWTDKNKDMPTIKKYLKYIFAVYSFAVGIFLRSSPHYPISWVVYSDYGHSVFLYTLPEHRDKGLSANIMSQQYVKLLNNGIIPLGERIRGSILTENFRHVEKCFPGYTWRDSITGECYW